MSHRPFTEFLANLRFGETHDELSAALNALVERCTATGKKGSLTLTVEIKPMNGNAVEISDTVKVKAPQFARGSTLMFPTPENNLVRNDPRQGTLDGVRLVEQDNTIRRPNIA